MDWAFAFLLLLPLSWWALNKQYRLIWGRKLKTRWAWASHGALLFSMRLRGWEAEIAGPMCPDCEVPSEYLGRKPAWNWFICPRCGMVMRERFRQLPK